MNYSDSFRAERAKRRMNQTAAAHATGLSRMTVGDLENGRLEISEQCFSRLVSKLDAARKSAPSR